MKKSFSLVYGSVGIAVVALQIELCRYGYIAPGNIKWGHFDISTMLGLMRLQQDLKIETDGVFDMAVVNAMREQLAKNLAYIISLQIDSQTGTGLHILEYQLRGVIQN